MARIDCRKCEAELGERSEACSHRGHLRNFATALLKSSVAATEGSEVRFSTWWLLAVGSVAGLPVLLAIGSFTSPPTQIAREREAIVDCWTRHEARSYNPDLQRFIAGRCDQMESTFRENHDERP